MLALTALVCMMNEPDLNPAGTVIVAGTLTWGELLVRLTTAPAEGARPFTVTNPVASAPPVIVFGEMERRCSEGGWTVTPTDRDVPSVAVIVTALDAVTWPYWNRNCVNAKPPGTV